ncbi:MAG: hypothetical protein HOV86_10800 [Thermoactinospora sp.]|nr:hypothetical protein [Thermoactinospora sp.]
MAIPVPAAQAPPSFHDDPCYRWAHLSRTLWWAPHTDTPAGHPAASPTTTCSSGTIAVATIAPAVPAVPAASAASAAPAGSVASVGAAPAPAAPPARAAPPAPALAVPAPVRSFLPDAQILVLRTPGACFAAKGGHNDEPHNHLDLGHFVLRLNGETVLDDLGAPEYTRDYFGEDRYKVLQASALGHSVPVINGSTQQPGPTYRAVVLPASPEPPPAHVNPPMRGNPTPHASPPPRANPAAHASSHAHAFVGPASTAEPPANIESPTEAEPSANAESLVLDLTRAYDAPSVQRFTRRFDWHPPSLVLTDEFVFTTGHGVVEELLISRLRPKLTPTTVTWGPATLTIPPGWSAEAEELSVQDHDGHPETVHRVRLSAEIASGSHSFHLRW